MNNRGIAFDIDEAMILRDALEDHKHWVTRGGYGLFGLFGECPPALDKLIHKMDTWLEENL